jgi:hypothetical protein
MQYLLLAYRDEQQWEALSGGERERIVRACHESDEALAASGQLLAAAVLEGACPATVRVHGGAVAVDVGAVAAAQEQLSAVLIISAWDLTEAIRVAATMPQARAGPIEVRPLVAQNVP